MEKLYQEISFLRKKWNIFNSSAVSKLDKEVNKKVSPEQKKRITDKFIEETKEVVHKKKDAKEALKNIVPPGIPEDSLVDLVDAAYMVYAFKVRTGTPGSQAYLIAVTFMVNNILSFFVMGKITPEQIKKDVDFITRKPYTSFCIGLLKFVLANSFIIFTMGDILPSIIVLIQSFKLLGRMIYRSTDDFEVSYVRKDKARLEQMYSEVQYLL